MNEPIFDEWDDETLPRAYTRQDVETYVAEVRVRRDELKARITDARSRAVRADRMRENLDALEASIGAAVVQGYARIATDRPLGTVVPDALATAGAPPAGPSPWLQRVAASVSGTEDHDG
jgi:hypothetical protein